MILREVQVKYIKHESSLSIDKITGTLDAIDIFREVWDKDDFDMIERCYILLLGKNHNVLGYKLLNIGGIGMTIIDPKIVANLCLYTCADSIILAHNHPSGNLKPSPEDYKITDKIRDMLKAIDVKLIDHIILTDNGYRSICD